MPGLSAAGKPRGRDEGRDDRITSVLPVSAKTGSAEAGFAKTGAGTGPFDAVETASVVVAVGAGMDAAVVGVAGAGVVNVAVVVAGAGAAAGAAVGGVAAGGGDLSTGRSESGSM